MKQVITYLLLTAMVAQAVPYQDFYIQPTGSNLNAGDSASDTADFTYASGNWDATTGVFTLASGTVDAAVSEGRFASVFDNSATQTGFSGRITGKTSTTITVSLTAKSGTPPSTASGTRTLKVGGAWAGMSGTNAFPFGWYSSAQTNAAADTAYLNFKGTYNITAGIIHTIDGPAIFQGYTTTPRDGGRAIIDGGTTGSYYTLIKFVAGPDQTDSQIVDFILQNNGATGSVTAAHGLWMNAGGFNALRIVVRNLGGTGILNQGVGVVASCEAYGCNQSNGSVQAGIATASSGAQVWNCFSHHNLGSNTDGFRVGSSAHFTGNISWANGRHGFNVTAGSARSIMQFDAYGNGGAGVNVTSGVTGAIAIENGNLVGNTGDGIDVNSTSVIGVIANCGFGTGTKANGGSQIAENNILQVLNSVNHTADTLPWSGADTGNFTITLSTAKNAGRGVFVQSDGGTTLGTPDIGAAFAADSGGGGGGGTPSLNTTNLDATNVRIGQ